MKRDWRTILTAAKEQGLSCSEVASANGCARSTVSHAQNTHGIRLTCKRRGAVEQRNWRAIFAQAASGGLSASEVARAESVSQQTVYSAAQRHSVALAHKPSRAGRPKGVGSHSGSRTRLHTDAFVEAAKRLEPANAFCVRLGICITKLKQLERAHGFKLPRRANRAIGART